jgi:hypothetical protein
MRRKGQPHQEESLFAPDSEVPGTISAMDIAQTDASDLEELRGITDAAKEEVLQLGGTALPKEVIVAEIEDLADQDAMTDEELKRIEEIVNTRRLSRRRAEAIILGEERAAKLNGEDAANPPKRKKKEEVGYPGRNPYKGKTRTVKHPAKVSRRVKISGDTTVDPDLR